MKHSVLLLIVLTLISITSCTNKKNTEKYLGNWTNPDVDFHLIITKSGDNFIISYYNLPEHYNLNEVLTTNNTLLGYYDKTKDNLVIKADKERNAIYDVNSNRLIVEGWGKFSRPKY